MYTGPYLLNSLTGFLLRFWNQETVLVTNMEAMFYQVKEKSADMDSLWFLWTEKAIRNANIDTYQMTVHVFGALDSPCFANYALQSVPRENFNEFDPVTIETILKSFYAHDLLNLVFTREDANQSSR